MTEKGVQQWTLRKTPERIAVMRKLRTLLNRLRPGEGEKIHGQLTDAQIFDWALKEFHEQLRGYRGDVDYIENIINRYRIPRARISVPRPKWRVRRKQS